MMNDGICTTRLQPEAATVEHLRQLVRSDRARGARSGAVFIEELIEGELVVLARRAMGGGRRTAMASNAAARSRPSAWQPDANADGRIRANRDRRAAAARSAGRRHDGMEEPGVARLPAPHACGRGADRGRL